MSELSSEARQLISTMADADGPPPDRHAQVKQRLLLRLSAVAAGAVIAKTAVAAPSSALSLPAAASASVTLGTIATAVAIGGVVGLGVVVPAATTTFPPASSVAKSSHSRTTDRHLPAKGAYPRGSAGALTSAAPEANEAASFSELAAPLARSPRSAASGTTARTAAVPDASEPLTLPGTRLAEEIALLDAARRELAVGHGAEALALVERHARRFPNGALREERTAAKVLALCELGRVDSAAALARALLGVAPESPLRQRLEQSCAFGGQQGKSRK